MDSLSLYQYPAFSVSKASTLHANENLRSVEVFQHDGQNWESCTQNAKTLVEVLTSTSLSKLWAKDCIARYMEAIDHVHFMSSLSFEDKELMAKVCSQYDIPDVFWTKTSLKASGYFGCCDSFDKEGTVTGHNLWLRFIVKMAEAGGGNGVSVQYYWEKIKVFSRFVASKRNVMICFDMPPNFQKALKIAVACHYFDFAMQDPFVMPSIVVEEVISLFDTSVWSLRDLVRSVERKREFTERPQPNYYQFHEISRHIIHSTETLSLSVKIVESMIEQHKSYVLDVPPCNLKARAIGRRVQHSLIYQKSLAQCLKGRSEALGFRLQNEISLAFNTVSQYDSQTAVKIGHATQADSASMRAISILTFLFFPGVFISSILGMDFFSFSPGNGSTPQRWLVSDKLWIFFALTIPLTCITSILWFLWQRRDERIRAVV